MLTVQMMIGTVEADRRNGSSQRRYHGYTTGAHRSDAAMGHANASEDHAGGLASQPDCGKKADEHCQPDYKLRSRHSLERCKHRIIKAETLHVSAE